MKKVLCIMLFLLFLPCLCFAQSVIIDYHIIGEIDQSLFWVLTDPNGIKYRGNSDIALGADPNAYCEAHKAEWLAAIYAMNTDPNVPDWVDSHPGLYQAGITLNNNIDTWAEQRNWNFKILKNLYPMRLRLD